MEEKEKQAQEMYMEYQALDQHIKQLQRQLEAITGQLMELSATRSGLDDFDKIRPGKEIFVPVSSGIFAKASIATTTEMLVNVGANVVVQKDLESTKKLIQKQVEEIKKIHGQAMEDLEKLTGRAAHLEMELQKLMPRE